MKVVIAGGSGQVGMILSRVLKNKGHDVCILSRAPSHSDRFVIWDGKTLGAWHSEIDGSDVVINLAGRTVNCRYTKKNLKQMMDSRVDSTRIIGEAIARSKSPPELWLQMSTATIYAHTFAQANDEESGVIGGQEPNVPNYWGYSVEIAKAWEKTLNDAKSPKTRKVSMRSAMVMSPDKNGIFDVLSKLVRSGLGGQVGSGNQFVSWIHENDFVRAVEFLIERKDISGAVNFSSPEPLPQKEFMAILRKAMGILIGLPATKWMAEIGAFFLRTDTELLLKSRKVVPTRLIKLGFVFEFPNWEKAARDLVARKTLLQS